MPPLRGAGETPPPPERALGGGGVRVSNNGEQFFVRSGESTFIRAAMKHRLENPGQIPLEVIEVQNGEFITEEDIARFEDDFQREL